MKILVLNHHARLSPRVQIQIRALEDAGYTVNVISWHRTPSLRTKTGSKTLLWMPVVYYRLFNKILKERFDVFHCTHLLLLPLALLMGKLKKAKIVYDDYDYFALMFAEKLPSKLKWLGQVVEWFENMLVKCVDQIFVIDLFNDSLRNRYIKMNSKVTALNNVPELSSTEGGSQQLSYAHAHGEYKTVIYIGGVKRDKCIIEMIHAFYEVSKRIDCVKLILIGGFRDHSEIEVMRFIRNYKLNDKVEFHDWMPYEKVLQYVRAASVGLALYQPYRRYLLARGNTRKLFTYMLYGVPVIASNFPGISEIITKEHCGLLVNPNNVNEIANAIIRLLSDSIAAREMGDRGRRAVQMKYNWEIEREKFLNAYKILSRKP